MSLHSYHTFAEVILPLAVPKNYTYAIPEEFVEQAHRGKRAVVQFGSKRIYTALLYRIHHEEPELYKPKPILEVLDPEPIINDRQLKLWDWMAEYYLCHHGDVMNAALPAGYKLESETRVILHPSATDDFSVLEDKEYLVAEALTIQNELTLQEIQEILGQKTVYPVIRELLDKRILVLKEELQQGYKPRTEDFIRLNPIYNEQKARRELFEELNNAPKQLELLMKYFQLQAVTGGKVKKVELLEATGKPYSSLKGLEKKGIFEKQEEEVSRLPEVGEDEKFEYQLSPAQQASFDAINDQFRDQQVVLLHGVTGSGKTEIYAEQMKRVVSEGKQILYLLPEIALTAQIIHRLRKIFGADIGIYHSKFNTHERVEIWKKTLSKEYKIVLGARSALFLPFRDLGLVVVDEEHDPSYKQFDPAPRYNARDGAIYLARLFDAKVILGSATPSLESYYNAHTKKYGLVTLKERFQNIKMPNIRVVDVTKSSRMKDFKSHLSEIMISDLGEKLTSKEQAILFRNRRGYSPMVICGTCGFTPQCKNCDVTLTYHKFSDQLKCHYCGYHQKVLTACPACGAHNMRVQGFGTEKLEDELKLYFDKVNVARMDYDAIKSKHGHQKVINDFEAQKIDILVGTQMVTKGLDFEKVALVGIVNADALLFFPDFRASERAFQLMVQVSGRAGRKNKQGEVLIQARNIHHPILRLVVLNDYEHFFYTELSQRKKFKYPPYTRLIYLHFRHKDKERVYEAGNAIYRFLSKHLANRVYEPVVPTPGRLRNQYLMNIMIKMERKKEVMHLVKNKIREALDKLQENKTFKSVHVHADVDPY